MSSKLGNNQKICITFDDSGDQTECFPDGYYIVVILEWESKASGGFWFNSGHVVHLATLGELEGWLEEVL